ncbi:MAG: response regulator transcription factor [Paludibacter sp.]|nr:response regulator transcription factor [Paludibacter sp.]
MNSNTFIICDSQYLTRQGFINLIDSFTENSTISSVFSKEDLIKKLEQDNSGIIIIDFELFDFDQLDEVALISRRFPDSKWLFTSGYIDDAFIHNLIELLPFANFVLKSDPEEDLLTAISSTRQGKRYYCSTALDIILGQMPQKKKSEVFTMPLLTPTEREIVHLLVSGKTTKEIADTRCLSFHTVGTHRKNIFRKMQVTTIHDLIKAAIKRGIVDYTEYYI